MPRAASFLVSPAIPTTRLSMPRARCASKAVSAMSQGLAEPLSTALVGQAKAEGLDVSHIAVDDERNIGIYAVATDAHGERSFSYWRSQSAARRLFAVEETALFCRMPTLSICPASRSQF